VLPRTAARGGRGSSLNAPLNDIGQYPKTEPVRFEFRCQVRLRRTCASPTPFLLASF
jgi:hypothetical protein